MNRSTEKDQSLNVNGVPDQERGSEERISSTTEKENERPEEIQNAGVLALVPNKKVDLRTGPGSFRLLPEDPICFLNPASPRS